MIDIDHFKLVNDNYSHQVGDEILRELAKVLQCSIWKEDLVARYGEEELKLVKKD